MCCTRGAPQQQPRSRFASGADRRRLADLGIDINADNGVFVSAIKHSPGVGTGPATHSSLHTDAYWRAVTETVATARTREEAIELLQMLRDDRTDGWAPR